jgi:hypothetical protein
MSSQYSQNQTSAPNSQSKGQGVDERDSITLTTEANPETENKKQKQVRNRDDIQTQGQGVDEPDSITDTTETNGETEEKRAKKKQEEEERIRKLILDKDYDKNIKLFRLLKVLTSILDSLPKDLEIAGFISWPLLLICDMIRLVLHTEYKKKHGDNPTNQAIHYIGGPKAIRLRAGQLILSTLRLIAHVLIITVGSIFPIAQPILTTILNALRAISSAWTITDDTCKFFDRMKEDFKRRKETFTPLKLFQKRELTLQEKQDTAFFFGKVLFFLVGIAAIAISACAAGPAAPIILAAIAIGLSIGSAAGYTTCSITQAFVNLATVKKLRPTTKDPVEKETGGTQPSMS